MAHGDERMITIGSIVSYMTRKQEPARNSPSMPGTLHDTMQATAVGLIAILLWSLMTALMRTAAESFGVTLGPALVYTVGSMLLMIFHRPQPLDRYPRRYLLVGGLLFVFYEASMALSIGLASTAAQSVEISLVNYLWPSMMVLLVALLARSGRPGSIIRVLPGVILSTVGVVLAVGGNSHLDPNTAIGHIATNPLPYVLVFMGALAWSVYAVIAPSLAHGMDGTTVFFPIVATIMWIIHFLSGDGLPVVMPQPDAWFSLLLAAAGIAGAYACWGYGTMHGSIAALANASYATPILSVATSAVILDLSLSLPFWCGAVLVGVGSMLNQRIGQRR